MPKDVSSQLVRAVTLRSTVGALGDDAELHTTLELQGLTAAWIPGDHGLCLVVGGGQVGRNSLQPALTVVLDPVSPSRLACSLTLPIPMKSEINPFSDTTEYATTIEIGAPGRTSDQAFVARGSRALIVTYKATETTLPFANRPFVIDISTHHHRHRIYLTREEVDDLNTVLRYTPPWMIKGR